MNENRRAAVVISTYNDPKSLGLCLMSYSNQSCLDFDIYIADDGSTESTRKKINSLRAKFPCKVEHLWHEDAGKFTKAKIHNEAFRKIKDYPITICADGDTIAHYRFIEDHLSFHHDSEPTLFMGRRVELGPIITQSLREKQIPKFNRGLTWPLLKSGLFKDSRCLTRSIRIPYKGVRTLLSRDYVTDLLGSNFSVSTSVLFEVNGYDEKFDAYWGEDGDLFIRMRNTGVKIVGSKSLALQYHLDHPRRPVKPGLREAYAKMLENKDYRRCNNGIIP